MGKNLISALECIRDGKDRVHRIYDLVRSDGIYDPAELNIVSYDVDSSPEELEAACQDCDFVFHLAGVNRPKDPSEYMSGNFGLSSILLSNLKRAGNICPVMLSSSIQATLIGRYGISDYGRSKLAGETLFLNYSEETGAKVLIYRFPNIFGKWCRPNYNSVVATFCYNYTHDLPIQVNDLSTELELLYIDDLVEELLDSLNSKEHRCEFDGIDAISNSDGNYCYVPVTHKVTLGTIVALLDRFQTQPCTLRMPIAPDGSFEKKLYSTYLSYLPEEKAFFPLKMNLDERGSFTELFKMGSCGQVSVNISKPGVTKGQHWHHSKWELFIVVSGHGLIRERKVGLDKNGQPYPVMEFEVFGEKMQAVHMLPGYTHSIINLSETENLVTVIWANEELDLEHPDTFEEWV